MKKLIIGALWQACRLTHPIVHHRPWLWLRLPVCPVAHAAFALERRWGIDVPVLAKGGLVASAQTVTLAAGETIITWSDG